MMATTTDAGRANLEQWIKDTSPLLAFYSNSKGGGFIGKRDLKTKLATKAAQECVGDYSPQKFNETWDLLITQGFIQHIIERGKPKGVVGSSAVPSPKAAKATTYRSSEPPLGSIDWLPAPIAAVHQTDVSRNKAGLQCVLPTDGARAPSVARLVRSIPTRSSSLTSRSSHVAPPAGLVTPGGSLTVETARELAAFGGAVIRRGASAQVNIAIPQGRVKGPPSTASSSSSSTSQSSTLQARTSQPSTPTAEAPVGPETLSNQDLMFNDTHIHTPEPTQPWKSLEVSLVDASLLKSFGAGLAVPDPVASQSVKPMAAGGNPVAMSRIRRAATLPVPPPRPMVHSVSAHINHLHQFNTSNTTELSSSRLQQSALPREAPPVSSTSEISPSQFSSQQVTHTSLHRQSGLYGHDLSRQTSSLSPNIIYSPPLRLSEISLPYKVQFQILTFLLSTLEWVFYEFSSKWFPEVLSNNLWDCPEAAEVTTWSAAILRALNSAPEGVQVSPGESTGTPIPQRARISRRPPAHALAHLTNLLKNVNDLHQDASRRFFISGEKLLAHLDTAGRVSSLLGCTVNAAELEEITYYVKEALGGIGIVKEAVRNAFIERMEHINKKREELGQMEEEALKEANRLEREQCTKLGWDLAVTLEPKVAKMEWASKPPRPRKYSWKEPILNTEQTNRTGVWRGQSSVDGNRKESALDQGSTPPLSALHSQPQDLQRSVSEPKHPNDVPPAIPAKAAKRLSSLYPPTSPASDYDTDIEHERESPGGVGLELTSSQFTFFRTASSSGSYPRSRRKERGTSRHNIESSDAIRPVTPAQVNMIREPVPQETPIPISKLIIGEGTPGTNPRKSGSLSLQCEFTLNEQQNSVLELASGVTPQDPITNNTNIDLLNTGPTPPLTPKEQKAAASLEDEASIPV